MSDVRSIRVRSASPNDLAEERRGESASPRARSIARDISGPTWGLDDSTPTTRGSDSKIDMARRRSVGLTSVI